MKSKKIPLLVILLAGTMLTVGCASQSRESRPIQRVHAALVLPTSLMLELADASGQISGGGWEMTRNDPATHSERGIPEYQSRDTLERHYLERLRTSQGRPREYSRYSTRVIQFEQHR